MGLDFIHKNTFFEINEQTLCEQLNLCAVFGELLLFVPGHKHTCYKTELGL